MKIIKHSGDVVDFERKKLERSLLKSGATPAVVEEVLKQIEKELYEGISTKKIYKLAFELLKEGSSSTAARYNLRLALELLGPAGFYFEKYISHLFRHGGYKTKINLNLKGRCVSHEVDLLVKKGEELTMIECKFHTNRDIVSDVKVPMYILSRYNDLNSQLFDVFDEKEHINKCLIVTNNRFSEDAVRFALCSGIELLSWDFPKNNNLRNRIDNIHFYPITCLTTLSLAEKEQLLSHEVILVDELNKSSEILEIIGLSPARITNVLKEVSELCLKTK